MNTAITLSLPFNDDHPAREYEWLITNGLGGYASGSLAGVNTRRYHGIFVPNLQNPKGRHVMISRLDEKIIMGNDEYQLGGTDFDGNLNDTATRWLKTFTADNNTARWLYEIGPLQLERTLMMPHQQNTVCIRYRVLTDTTISLHLRPYLPFRRQDAELTLEAGNHFKVAINGDHSEVTSDGLSLFIATQPGPTHFISESDVANQQLLTREQSRGYACHESTLSPGYFVVNLAKENQASFIASAHPWENVEKDIDKTFDAEAKRINAIAVRAETQRDANEEAQDDMIAKLTVAADQFLVQPGSRLHEESVAAAEGHQLRSVIAGYHWFSDWGRDTMIALEGLMLCTGRFQEARATLLTFSHYVKDGLLPNLFPEGERVGLYHTVDATLWYFHAIHRYIQRSSDAAILTEMLPILRGIIKAHLEGTLFGIHADPADMLLAASSPDHALTWMDAKMGDWIVTPRRGKPVEIQALWYNALCLMSEWDQSPEAIANYSVLAAQARASFNRRFWIEAKRYLYDVVDGENANDNGNDARLRPNQIFAISLDHPILDHQHWPAVIDTVQQHLLTPMGLRTLSPDDPDYQRTYGGNLRSRDGAYHQGTVWPWLLASFIEAWLKVHGDRLKARELLDAFNQHLDEAGIGTISEVFDAESPHEPHGCIAQAWSVAEILRAWHLTTTSKPQ